MSSEATTGSPASGHFQDENLWKQEVAEGPVPENQTTYQWAEVPPGELPIPVVYNGSNNVPDSAFKPCLVQNNGTNNDNFNGQSFENTYHNNPLNGLYTPDGLRYTSAPPSNGSIVVTPRLPISNGFNVNNANGWMPNGRYIARIWNNATKTTAGARKPKRIRTAFTSQQMMDLEQEYSRTRYLDRTRRIELAEVLRLNERTIKIWFQNRRMKEKKDRAESIEDSEATSTTESSPELSVLPVLVADQMNNEMYSSEDSFVEQFPMTSTPNVFPHNNMQVQSPMLNYPTYVTEEYQAQYRPVHMQMQYPPPPYSNELQGITDEFGRVHLENQPMAPNNNIVNQNWDLSWIRSMQITDDC